MLIIALLLSILGCIMSAVALTMCSTIVTLLDKREREPGLVDLLAQMEAKKIDPASPQAGVYAPYVDPVTGVEEYLPVDEIQKRSRATAPVDATGALPGQSAAEALDYQEMINELNQWESFVKAEREGARR